MKRVVRKGDSFFDSIFSVSAFLMGFCMKNSLDLYKFVFL